MVSYFGVKTSHAYYCCWDVIHDVRDRKLLPPNGATAAPSDVQPGCRRSHPGRLTQQRKNPNSGFWKSMPRPVALWGTAAFHRDHCQKKQWQQAWRFCRSSVSVLQIQVRTGWRWKDRQGATMPLNDHVNLVRKKAKKKQHQKNISSKMSESWGRDFTSMYCIVL